MDFTKGEQKEVKQTKDQGKKITEDFSYSLACAPVGSSVNFFTKYTKFLPPEEVKLTKTPEAGTQTHT